MPRECVNASLDAVLQYRAFDFGDPRPVVGDADDRFVAFPVERHRHVRIAVRLVDDGVAEQLLHGDGEPRVGDDSLGRRRMEFERRRRKLLARRATTSLDDRRQVLFDRFRPVVEHHVPEVLGLDGDVGQVRRLALDAFVVLSRVPRPDCSKSTLF